MSEPNDDVLLEIVKCLDQGFTVSFDRVGTRVNVRINDFGGPALQRGVLRTFDSVEALGHVAGPKFIFAASVRRAREELEKEMTS